MQSTYGETKKEFAHEIAIADRVDTVLAYARKAERECQKFLIERNGRSCERTGTERENVGPIQTIAQPFCVALKCFDLPKQVMRKSDGLCALQVCVAGHHHLEMFFGEIEQRSLQTPQARRDFRDLSFDVKPQVERDLVVPAPRGVQFRASGTDSFRQRGFDVHVQVIERAVPRELARLDFLPDREQSTLNFSALRRAYDSCARERCGVRDRPRDVVAIQLPIERDGFAVVLRNLSGGFVETSFAHVLTTNGHELTRIHKTIRSHSKLRCLKLRITPTRKLVIRR